MRYCARFIVLASFILFLGHSVLAKSNRHPAQPAVENTAVATTPIKNGNPHSVKRIEEFNVLAKKGDLDLIFIGDSITRNWELAGKKFWDKYYGDRKPANFGIGGEGTGMVLWRLQNGNIDGISPKVAVLLIGTNNAGIRKVEQSPVQIAAGVKAIVDLLRKKLPRTKVLVLGIFPRGAEPSDPFRKRIAAANSLIANLHNGRTVFYLDIGEKFLDANGKATDAMTPDRIHLTERGYQAWAEAMEPTLVKLLKKK